MKLSRKSKIVDSANYVDITVNKNHNFVLENGAVVHNCGVGFEPVTGTLNGFAKSASIEVIRSTRHDRGFEWNKEEIYTRDDGKLVCHITLGDSGLAWAKAAGKLMAMKYPVDVVVLDFSEVRPGGKPLRGFGWISSGDEQIHEAFTAISELLSNRTDQILSRIDIMDIMNWLGTSLSSRRSAEICLLPADDPEAEEFASAKKEYWKTGNKQRGQSNNSLVFYHRPSKREIRGLFSQMLDAGGSEPGFVNGAEARRRAPWFRGLNPCGEILLGNKSFCNLVTIVLSRFNGRFKEIQRALWILGRANYRQTCVDLRDGVLQHTWHELNQFLRLTGISCMGIVNWEYHKNRARIEQIHQWAREAVDSMADELNLPRSKAVTTVKPEGSQSKTLESIDHSVTEGIHKPLSKYIINKILISKASPVFAKAIAGNYRWIEHPSDKTSALVDIPVAYENVEFDTVTLEDGTVLEVNNESAVDQLNRYKLWNEAWADHNVSITVSYDPSEVEQIVNWLYNHWDSFVGVSFILRTDPTKTAEDLGYPYLPQQPITKEAYDEYVATLLPVDLDSEEVNSLEQMKDTSECAGGVCPIR